MSESAPASSSKKWRAEQCVAICDYQAQDSSEISFSKGDVISVTGKRGDASGFWEGVTTGVNIDILTGKKNKAPSVTGSVVPSARGLFPTCMVSSNMRAFHEPKFCDKVLVLYDYKARAPEEMDLTKGDVLTVIRPSNSPGWWYGIKEGTGSRVTEKCMSGPVATPSSPAASSERRSREKLIPLNFVTAKIVVGGMPCQGNAVNEIPFTTGDVIHVIRRWNDGWWEGTLRGHRGIFPSNLTHPNVGLTTPALFCFKCKTILQGGSSPAAAAAATTSGNSGSSSSAGIGGKGAGQSCPECTQNEAIVEKMLLGIVKAKQRAAEGTDKRCGELNVGTVDLFADVDVEALLGKRLAQELKKITELVEPTASGNSEITTVRRFQV